MTEMPDAAEGFTVELSGRPGAVGFMPERPGNPGGLGRFE